jgi:hypothetical protein
MVKHLRNIFRFLTLGDLVLILTMIFFSGSMIFSQNFKKHSSRVKVLKNGVMIKELDLEVDQIYNVDAHSAIEVKNGKIRMLKSDCPGQHCVKQGWSNRVPIICVPNHLVLQFENEAEEVLITY